MERHDTTVEAQVAEQADTASTYTLLVGTGVPLAFPDYIKRVIDGGPAGLRVDDLIASIHQEYKEHEDLPNTTNPDDWAKISGKKGERIVYVRTLVHHDTAEDATGGRSIEAVATGQYL